MKAVLLVIFVDGGYARIERHYTVVPTIDDYVMLPGFGELGVKVYSRIFGPEGYTVTLQFRNCLFVDGLEAYGWKVTRG